MATSRTPDLFVVDGSNIATEGRNNPSLEQLNEAVLAFLDDRPGVRVTVVVDATFGHRIDKKEVSAFDEAVANNELVTPPAGAVGRGDAFVLSIAHKAKAGVLSNDSFQEFHGEYEWLFDDGRLVGGKPVPHVGWVFVERTPVRGPKSRQAVREAKEDAQETKERANRRVRKKAASPAAEPPAEQEPVEEPAEPTPPSGRSRRGRRRRGEAEAVGPEQQATIEAAKAAPRGREHVNELMPFLEFVERHPVGTSCTGVVESYASHGAYARVDDVLIYIPLRLMDDPPPRSARSVLTTGEAVAVVIVGYVPDRRSIDAALPHMTPAPGQLAAAPAAEPAEAPASRSRRSKRGAAKAAAAEAAPTAAASPSEQPAAEPAAKKAAAEKAPAKKAAAKKTAAKKTATKKAPAKKAAAKKTAAKKTAAEKTGAEKAPAEKATAEKTAEKATAEKTAKKAAAKKTATKKAPAKKAAPKKTAARKRATKKTAAKKTAAAKQAASEQGQAPSGSGTPAREVTTRQAGGSPEAPPAASRQQRAAGTRGGAGRGAKKSATPSRSSSRSSSGSSSKPSAAKRGTSEGS